MKQRWTRYVTLAVLAAGLTVLAGCGYHDHYHGHQDAYYGHYHGGHGSHH